MNENYKRYTFYIVFFLCAFIGMFIFLNIKSFAYPQFTLTSRNGNQGYERDYSVQFRDSGNARLAIWINNPNNYPRYNFNFYSNENIILTFDVIDYYNASTQVGETSTPSLIEEGVYTLGIPSKWSALNSSVWSINTSPRVPVFYDYESMYNYLSTGELPQLPFDEELELDTFKVTSWSFGNTQAIFDSKFEVTWSNPEISLVQVILESTGGRISFESSNTPFKRKFEPENYVIKKGDIVHMTATPYKSDGSYGVSLYQSFVYDDRIPFSNIYRKFTNTPYSDNTLTIPYTGVSGQPQSVTLPVDGVATNNIYKVNYNPVTNEYGDMNVYEIYYSPVVIYPENTSDQEVDDTQEVVNNTYTTNNYYETTKNININFDVSFGDISGSDIQHGYDDFGNFVNGFGGFFGKVASWIVALFPFLSPAVASTIVVCVGLIVLLAIIAFVLKIASVIADLIPF